MTKIFGEFCLGMGTVHRHESRFDRLAWVERDNGQLWWNNTQNMLLNNSLLIQYCNGVSVNRWGLYCVRVERQGGRVLTIPGCAVAWWAAQWLGEQSPRPDTDSRPWPEVWPGQGAPAAGSRWAARRRLWSLWCDWTTSCTGSLEDPSRRSNSTVYTMCTQHDMCTQWLPPHLNLKSKSGATPSHFWVHNLPHFRTEVLPFALFSLSKRSFVEGVKWKIGGK